MFATDDYVFYESGGICKIEAILTSPLEGMPAEKLYYVVRSVHDSNGVMYVPVDNENIYLRPLLNRQGAELIMSQIPKAIPFEEPNAKQLRNRFVEAMHTHEPMEWVRVIMTVRRRMGEKGKGVRRISETERSFYDSAKQFLFTELSLALGVSGKEIEETVLSHLDSVS